MSLPKISFIVVIVIISIITPDRTTNSVINHNSPESAFQVVQIPSGIQVPVGMNIDLELKPIPAIFKDIDRVLFFSCLFGAVNTCETTPVTMVKNGEDQSFHYSLTPSCSNTQIRYRFIAYYTNGTPYCFPDCLQLDNNPNIIKVESGLYYFIIEITESPTHLANTSSFPFLIVIVGCVLSTLLWNSRLRKKRKN